MKNIVKSNYLKLFGNITSLLEEARKKTVRQINTVMVETYWQVGRLIVEEEQKGQERAKYGDYLIQKLSKDLTKKLGRGFDIANVWNMRQFYLTYPKLYALRRESKTSKLYAVRSQLTWTHFRILMRIDDELARSFYEIEIVKNNWSTRELDRQINSLLFERIALSKDKKGVLKLSQKGQVIEKPEDAIKSPYILEFLGIPEKSYYVEKQLEQKLIDHLHDFVLELGKGFTFVARQKRITIDNEHYYIDLVFYHRILKCLVLVDLKVGGLDHKDVGQMNFYLNYIKKNEMVDGENPPIGIILCTEKNKSKVFVEYALGGISNKIFVSKYKLYLPTKKELETEIRKEAQKFLEV
ncbi:MAG: PDDEXK nuclease domain-containing protein [Elusimicrobiota bacterium]